MSPTRTRPVCPFQKWTIIQIPQDSCHQTGWRPTCLPSHRPADEYACHPTSIPSHKPLKSSLPKARTEWVLSKTARSKVQIPLGHCIINPYSFFTHMPAIWSVFESLARFNLYDFTLTSLSCKLGEDYWPFKLSFKLSKRDKSNAWGPVEVGPWMVGILRQLFRIFCFLASSESWLKLERIASHPKFRMHLQTLALDTRNYFTISYELMFEMLWQTTCLPSHRPANWHIGLPSSPSINT